MSNKGATSSQKKSTVGSVLSGYSFVLIMLVILAGYLIINRGATTWSGIVNILRHSAVVGIMAFGMGLVIITGGIDLSIGSMLSLVGGFAVVVFNATDSVILTLLFCVVFGGLCGFLNGILIGKAHMPAFIVTLATMMIFRSISQYKLRTTGASIYHLTGENYDAFYGFGQSKVATIPSVGLILILITIIMVFIATKTKYGKSIYALGSNEKGAGLAGINVDWVRVSVYIITGVLVGISAFLWLAMNGSVDPATLGKSNEMYAIAAVVIGGISMSGGKGKLVGVLFGAMSYTIIDKIIASLGVDALINDTIKGIILLIAVLIQILVPVIRDRIKAKKLQEANNLAEKAQV